MTREDEPLRRSMDAAPEDWLDRLVHERVVAQVQGEAAHRRSVQRENAALRARAPSEPAASAARRAPPGIDAGALARGAIGRVRAWLSRLVPPEARVLIWRDGDRSG